MKATKIKDLNSRQALYRLDPPLPYERYEDADDPVQKKATFVVVSCANSMVAPETYIFPADADGNVRSWGELDGSFRGGYDHEQALQGAGYEVVRA